MPRLLDRFGGGAATQIATQVTELLGGSPRELERIGLDRAGRLLVLLPETAPHDVDAHLRVLARRIAAHASPWATRTSSGSRPVTGWASVRRRRRRARAAGPRDHRPRAAGDHLDLLPVRWTPSLEVEATSHKRAGWVSRTLDRLRLPVQFLATLLLGVGLPFVPTSLLGRIGWDVSGVAYWVVMARPPGHRGDDLARGLPRPRPAAAAGRAGCAVPVRDGGDRGVPAQRGRDDPVDTVEAFQRLDYPGDLQILVAYNTPDPLAVEDDLREMARQDPRILPLKVPDSTSKAQNVNAAMSHVTGEFVGMFDADHHPEPGAFRRAWRWLSNGYDVVQGHCVIRNGDASLRRPHGGRRVRVDLRRQPPRAAPRCTASGSSAAPTATGAPACWPRPGCTARCSPRTSTPRCGCWPRAPRSPPTRRWSPTSSPRRTRGRCGSSGPAGRRAGSRSPASTCG